MSFDHSTILATLSLCELFDGLTETQKELVAAISETVTIHRGDFLFYEHDSSDDLYIIAQGIIEILLNTAPHNRVQGEEPTLITEMRPGQVLGEIALVDQGVRSAGARAGRNNTTLLRFSRSRLMLLCDTYPELGYKLMHNLAEDLARKMRNTDLTLRQFQLILAGT